MGKRATTNGLKNNNNKIDRNYGRTIYLKCITKRVDI